MFNGIDASSVQGVITPSHWATLKSSGIDFVFAKAWTGNDGGDPYYTSNVQNATDAGLSVGSYMFLYPLPNAPGHVNRDPAEQAKLHFSHCVTSCVAGDAEWPEKNDWQKWGIDANFINDWLLTYMQTYTALAGRSPLIYTYPYWAQAVSFRQDFAQYQLWLASYEPQPATVSPWGVDGWTVWQDSGGTSFRLPSGVPCDTDKCKDLSIFQ